MPQHPVASDTLECEIECKFFKVTAVMCTLKIEEVYACPLREGTFNEAFFIELSFLDFTLEKRPRAN